MEYISVCLCKNKLCCYCSTQCCKVLENWHGIKSACRESFFRLNRTAAFRGHMCIGLGLYFESDPEAAMQLILQFDLTFLLDPPFELMIALAFVVYVIFVGALSLLINMSQRLDQSVKVLEEIIDAVQYNNSENY